MADSGIQGQLLEITVVGCSRLRDTEWISRQDPYVCLEYASSKFRTRTCTDGGKNPTFQEKFVFTMIEGLREINVVVWNSNTITYDDFIGSGKIQLQKVLSSGYDDSSWPIQTKNGRHAGEVRLIMHYNKPATVHHAPSAPPYGVSHTYHSQNSPHGYAPPTPYAYPPPQSAYAPPPPQAYPSPYPNQPQPPPAYPQSSYPPQSRSVYPPAPSTYPPSTYPPPPQWRAPQYPPQGPYGTYPPPPY